MNCGKSVQVSIVDLGGAPDFDEENLFGEFISFDGENQRVQTLVHDPHTKIFQNLWAEEVGD